jgi:valyl-tRNA synthetase
MNRGESLPPQYNPTGIEAALYELWEKSGFFSPRGSGRPYVIMMPPPNVTANLHMGHGLTYTIQDVLIRFERMRGRATLWLPGTDHAGIATQNVVERLPAQEGLTRFDLGRDAFVERVWEYVRTTGAAILEQLEAIGCSADWSRTYFTLDEDLSRAVREVFVTLFEKGLIYRGKYIINWCPRCLTALSNEEVDKEETEGKIWRIRYPIANQPDRFIVVATTRPETMLGDTAVAVHPADPRYKDLVGKEAVLPLVGRRLPIISDAAVDPKFGTGAVKVTPAHDPLDFDIGRRHHLPSIDIMADDATIRDPAPAQFQGLDRFEARKMVVAEVERLGLLEKVEAHPYAIGRCYRCETIVEPRLSDQWFVKMEPLAKPSLQAYRDTRLRFLPEHRGTEYAQWMENIRDWCISRQLWWGHRIPVWYCDRCGKVIASRTDLASCPDCKGPVRQDEDVLDTWFSSQLVPFSSLGWPQRPPELERYYPGDVLVTAPEILFFWVARMVMSGIEFMEDIPFHTVYLHGTVRDTQHRKMSKSLGNGIDPLDVISRYGADALRYTVVSGLSVGTDLILDPDDIETTFAPGRNFANKLWNLGRFILSNLDGPVRPLVGAAPAVQRSELALADRWILARCEETVREATLAYERFRLNDAALAIHRFLWSDMADWYVEAIKPRLYGESKGGDVARAVVTRGFETALRLLHPVMPFITETLWKALSDATETAGQPSSLMIASWPRPDHRAVDPDALARFAVLQELVGAIRSIRAEYSVPPGHTVRASVSKPGSSLEAVLRSDRTVIQRMAKLSELALVSGGSEDGAGTGSAVLSDGSSVSIPLGDMVDLGKECARLRGEADRLTEIIRKQDAKLANQDFVTRAPAEVVSREREKLAAWRDQVAVLVEKQRKLGCDSRR